jgi:hypothetical protein
MVNKSRKISICSICNKNGHNSGSCLKFKENKRNSISKMNKDEFKKLGIKLNSSVEKWIITIEPLFKEILEKEDSTEITYDFLRDEEDIEEEKNAKKIIQRQMKRGKLVQIAMGNYGNNEDLKQGKGTGLDIQNKKNKFIGELKFSYHTDNASSRKTNLQKLSDYKKAHPDYTCFYGIINEKDGLSIKKIKENDGQEFLYLSGDELFKFVFGSDYKACIEIIKYLYKKYKT